MDGFARERAPAPDDSTTTPGTAYAPSDFGAAFAEHGDGEASLPQRDTEEVLRWQDLADAGWLTDTWIRLGRTVAPGPPAVSLPEHPAGPRSAPDPPPAPAPRPPVRPSLSEGEPAPFAGLGPPFAPGAPLVSPGLTESFEPPERDEPPGRDEERPPRQERLRGLAASLARALHRLDATVPSHSKVELDEQATAEQGLADGLWLPMFVPTAVTALDLVLLADSCVTLTIWEPEVAALAAAARHSGAFRDVRTARLSLSSEGTPSVRWDSGATASPGELVDGRGERVFLLVTDGLAHGWAAPAADRLLSRLAQAGPTAVVHLLPPHLRHRSSLYPHPALLEAGGRNAPNTALVHRPRQEDPNPLRPFPAADDGIVPVPVLSLKEGSFQAWADIVRGGQGVRRVLPIVPAGALAKGTPARGVRPPHTDTRFATSATVHRFMEAAGPVARRLATHLAAAPFDLTLIGQLCARMLPETEPADIAEVLTGGLIDWGTGPDAPAPPRHEGPQADDGLADFAPGVREALLATSTRSQLARVVTALGELPAAGTEGAALLAALLDPLEAELPDPTAVRRVRLERAVLNALSGRHALRARLMDTVINANAHIQVNPDVKNIDDVGSHSARQANEFPGGGVPTHPTTSPMKQTPPQLPEDLAPTVDGERPAPVRTPEPPPARPPSGAARAPAIMGNVPPRNRYFTGREQLLTDVERQLRDDSTAAVLPHALHGMGGVGKSQIAIEYVYAHRGDYNVIWWIPAESESLILGALAELASRLGLATSQEANMAVPAVREALRTGVPYDNWLLVFDNAEAVDSVRSYFPTDGPGKIIVTSRNRDWERVATPLSVDVFKRDESVKLLQRRARDLSPQDAERLAEALGDLPLAVEQAGTWHANTGMAIDEYLQLLDARQPEILELDPSPDYPVSVAAAWDISLDHLTREHPGARRLLDVCACMAPEPVPLSVLRLGRGGGTEGALRPVLADSIGLSRATRVLNQFSLVRLNHSSGTLQMHRLLQTVLLAKLDPDSRAAMREVAHLLLSSNRPGHYAQSTQWPEYQRLLPHIRASEAHRSTDTYVRELVYDTVLYLYYWGDHDAAIELARDAWTAWLHDSGEENLHVIRIAKILGFLLRRAGVVGESYTLNKDALDVSRRVGVPDEDLIDSMWQMSGALCYAGRFTEARDQAREAVELARDRFGPDDLNTLLAAHSYGVTLRLCGDFGTARELDTETHRQWELLNGPTDVLTLNTLNGLGWDILEGGDYHGGREQQEETYDTYRATYGEEAPETLTAARMLSLARRRDGDLEGAASLSEETLRLYSVRYGPNYTDTLATALQVTVDRRLLRDLDGSRSLGEQVLDQFRDRLGPDHAYTLMAMANLAATHRARSDLDTAERLADEASERLETTLGARHVVTLMVMLGRANNRYASLDFGQAREIDETALEGLTEIAGAAHPVTLACMANLALDLRGLGSTARADELRRRAVDGLSRVVRDGHPWLMAARFGHRIEADPAPMPL
ncbi:FxSxx-COOH system tetratricopeptide repeat protein [Streptomyces sp. AC550_RSS872]|uniref:FxSxx-COOH system tetratricopeptide repeat protein n=1 Tax=Streptomyces sp. AC550_RSS872 TaxID=2823689 RepID=UPI001C27C0AD|nr:FxSxx-COOH system tetratricopeptide repeat protein [Streptomyces sp. AC550_RSS872]